MTGRRARGTARDDAVADDAVIEETIAEFPDRAGIARIGAVAVADATARRLHRCAELLERTGGAGALVAAVGAADAVVALVRPRRRSGHDADVGDAAVTVRSARHAGVHA